MCSKAVIQQNLVAPGDFILSFDTKEVLFLHKT